MHPKHAPRLEGLDALRGLAALSVVLYHYTAWYGYDDGGHPAPGTSLVFVHGNFGVDLFFIISGFVITMTLERTRSLADFLFARLARLYPAFLASFLVTVAALIVFPRSLPGLGLVAANLTMMPEVFGERLIDGSYWSLYHEIDFYVLAGGVFFLFGRRAPEFPCALWLTLSVALRLKAASWVPGNVALFTDAPFSQLFVIGTMLYRIRSGRASVATWVVLGLACLATLVSRYWSLGALSQQGYMLLICAFAAMTWLATLPRLRVPRPLRFLGRISYPLYLVHQQAGFILIARLEENGIQPDLAVLLTLCAALCVACVLSAAVEYPAQAWLKARYAAWNAQATLSPG